MGQYDTPKHIVYADAMKDLAHELHEMHERLIEGAMAFALKPWPVALSTAQSAMDKVMRTLNSTGHASRIMRAMQMMPQHYESGVPFECLIDDKQKHYVKYHSVSKQQMAMAYRECQISDRDKAALTYDEREQIRKWIPY